MNNINSHTSTLKLFMLLLGSKPPGRHVEQHDFFFGIASSISELIPEIKDFWPEAGDRIHVDAWREVKLVEGYEIKIIKKTANSNSIPEQGNKLFFINLGGYQENKFEEQHYSLLTIKSSSALALKEAKTTLFFQQNHFAGAASHIDDKYGIDVDDIYQIEDMLSPTQKEKYQIELIPSANLKEDQINLGYLKLS